LVFLWNRCVWEKGLFRFLMFLSKNETEKEVGKESAFGLVLAIGH
jgi:hypothetical protein